MAARGLPTRVSKVRLSGIESLPPEHRAAVWGALPLKEGGVFLEEPWERTERLLTRALVELGYGTASVETEAFVNLAAREARLELEVHPGRRYRFGEVRVDLPEGARVGAERIAEQVHRALRDEPWYSESALAEAQARVFALGVFTEATVRPGSFGSESGEVPVVVRVREAPYRTVRLGVGVGFEQRRNGVHALAELIHRDFMGDLRRLDLELSAGYAFIPNVYAVATGADVLIRHGAVARLAAELEQPRLFRPELRLDGRLELERGLEPAYAFSGGRARVGTPWRPLEWLTITPSYNLELYVLEAGRAELRRDAPTLLFGCPAVCVLSYLEQRVEIDRRDDRREPRHGYYGALSLQIGGGPLGGTFRHVRLLPEARGYLSPVERLTLSARVRVGTLLPASGEAFDGPIVARFHSGGDRMRGFSARRLSPMYVVPFENPGASTTPSRSRSEATGSSRRRSKRGTGSPRTSCWARSSTPASPLPTACALWRCANGARTCSSPSARAFGTSPSSGRFGSTSPIAPTSAPRCRSTRPTAPS